jgi:hypothetical protein
MTDRMPESVLKRLSQRLGGFFKNGKFTVGAFGSSVGYENKDAKPGEQEFLIMKDRAVSALSNIVSGLEEMTDDSKRLDGVLIVIDEVHNLRDIDGAAQVLRAISTTLDVNRLGKVSFMVLGYPDGIERFFTGDPSARRHFDMIELTAMPRNEAMDVLTKGFEKIALSFSRDDLARNIDVAGGYPHSIQVIGHHLVDVGTEVGDSAEFSTFCKGIWLSKVGDWDTISRNLEEAMGMKSVQRQEGSYRATFAQRRWSNVAADFLRALT